MFRLIFLAGMGCVDKFKGKGMWLVEKNDLKIKRRKWGLDK